MKNMQGGQESVIQANRAGGTGRDRGRNRWAKGSERRERMEARSPRAVEAKRVTGPREHRFQ